MVLLGLCVMLGYVGIGWARASVRLCLGGLGSDRLCLDGLCWGR